MASFYSGTNEDFDALVFGQPHPSTLQYLQSTIQGAMHNASQATQRFFSKAQEVYQHFYSEEAMRRARAALNRASGVFVADDIRYLESMNQLTAAKEQMRRYIMANPYIRQQFYKQQIEGFAEYYHDNAPGFVGDLHEDYQRVMDGVVQVDEQNGDHHYSLYYGYDTDNEHKLDLDQQVAISDTWLRVQERIKAGGQDPTSVWGSML